MFDLRPSKSIGHLFNIIWCFPWRFIAIDELELDLLSRNAKIGPKMAKFWPLWPWSLTYEFGKFTNNKLFSQGTMCQNIIVIRLLEHCQKAVTDGRADGQTRVFYEMLVVSKNVVKYSSVTPANSYFTVALQVAVMFRDAISQPQKYTMMSPHKCLLSSILQCRTITQ